MNPDQVQEQADLTEAVTTLVKEVRGLNAKLELYAPRTEVKRDGRRRAWTFFGSAIIIILLAQLLTMTTISYCFLDATGARKAACGVMPGYNEAYRQGEVRLTRFELLLTQIELNRAEIEKLQLEIDELKADK